MPAPLIIAGMSVSQWISMVIVPSLVIGAQHALKETTKTFINNLFDNAYSAAVTAGVQWLDKNIEMPDFIQDSVNSALYAGAYSFRSKVESVYSEKYSKFKETRKKALQDIEFKRKIAVAKAMIESKGDGKLQVMIQDNYLKNLEMSHRDNLSQVDKGYDVIGDVSQTSDIFGSGMSDIANTKHQSIISQTAEQQLVKDTMIDLRDTGVEMDENGQMILKQKGWNGMTLDEIMGKYILGKGIT